MKTELFDYKLPVSFIAQKPLPERDHSNLLVLDRKTGDITHDRFFNIGKYLYPGDVLVINESKVNRCRIFGKKETTGAEIECFVLKKAGNTDKNNEYEVLLKPSKRLKDGDRVLMGDHSFKVISKAEYGKAIVSFDCPVSEIFKSIGEMPLPPYIRGRDFEENRYQTVYAAGGGSTAAPTAGLHFTKKLMSSLKEKKIIFAKITLDIGLDTFRPISVPDISEHRMHSEFYHIEKSQAHLIDEARKSGNKIIAVGTTTVRVLETLMQKYGKINEDSGSTDIYIYPPFEFRIVDSMITNFHLPRSTLLVMVSAFAGRDMVMKSYEEAKEKNYRFYSFGDCMLIK
ncbi:MAG: tRNA preQ1(34) S-adenosylmethionine ribosyltransferase-isomerase QueA [Actinomycetota bacterium]|nr:MAG: tRNA preQ1(34) S-adenosylmethionine ribosyltransferase-isomerase QueA [Actinomycetota bacterium]